MRGDGHGRMRLAHPCAVLDVSVTAAGTTVDGVAVTLMARRIMEGHVWV